MDCIFETSTTTLLFSLDEHHDVQAQSEFSPKFRYSEGCGKNRPFVIGYTNYSFSKVELSMRGRPSPSAVKIAISTRDFKWLTLPPFVLGAHDVVVTAKLVPIGNQPRSKRRQTNP